MYIFTTRYTWTSKLHILFTHPKEKRNPEVLLKYIIVPLFWKTIKLTHYVPVLPSYRNQSIDLHSKSIHWFLYEGNNST